MNDVNIKDYLKVNMAEANVKNRTNSSYTYPCYNYKIILDNGSDVIIRRTSGTGIERDFTIIPSDNLVFIRDVKKGIDKVVLSEGQVNSFFQDAHKDLFEQLKNSYWHCEYSSNFTNKVTKMRNSEMTRELLKKGLNPLNITGHLSNNEEKYLLEKIKDSPTTFNKITNKILEVNDKLKTRDKNGCSGNLLVITLSICEDINFNNAIWFLDRLSESNSKFDIPAFKGYYGEKSNLIQNLVKKYNLDFQSLINYLFFDLYIQGISNIDEYILEIYNDTLNMQSLMYDGKVRDKYPKHLKETHDKVTLIYNLNQQYFDNKMAVKLQNVCKSLEYQDGDYCIITPEDSSELINEGINLHHCVGSYVERVNSGKTSILFLREVANPDESLITIEYKDDAIKQVRGLCERHMNYRERKFFDKWVKKFKIRVDGE